MLTIRLDSETERRLQRLARKTGRTKTAFACEAIMNHIDDMEDVCLAADRLSRQAKTYSDLEVKRELGLKCA